MNSGQAQVIGQWFPRCFEKRREYHRSVGLEIDGPVGTWLKKELIQWTSPGHIEVLRVADGRGRRKAEFLKVVTKVFCCIGVTDVQNILPAILGRTNWWRVLVGDVYEGQKVLISLSFGFVAFQIYRGVWDEGNVQPVQWGDICIEKWKKWVVNSWWCWGTRGERKKLVRCRWRLTSQVILVWTVLSPGGIPKDGLSPRRTRPLPDRTSFLVIAPRKLLGAVFPWAVAGTVKHLLQAVWSILQMTNFLPELLDYSNANSQNGHFLVTWTKRKI